MSCGHLEKWKLIRIGLALTGNCLVREDSVKTKCKWNWKDAKTVTKNKKDSGEKVGDPMRRWECVNECGNLGRGSRVCLPKMCLLGIFITLSWFFLRNKGTQKGPLNLPLYLTKRTQKNLLKGREWSPEHHINSMTYSVTDRGKPSKVCLLDFPLCPISSGWPARITLSYFCSFSSTSELHTFP